MCLQTDWRGFTAKVSDFGLSKLLAEIAPVSVANLTEDNQKRDCSGTVTHMAPELLSEGANSSAADVYAFGIMSEYLVKALSEERSAQNSLPELLGLAAASRLQISLTWAL